MAKETKEYVCPLTVNYIELEALIGNKTIAEYIGDKLPAEEVERIEIDFAIYKQNKK